MIDPRFVNVLRVLQQKLPTDEISWLITGSCNLALQGMDIKPHDIDLKTDEAGAYEIEKRFLPNIVKKVEFSTGDKIRSHFGRLDIEGVKVEIMGDSQLIDNEGEWKPVDNIVQIRQFLKFENMRLPVCFLKYEYTGYLLLGRLAKAEEILIYMKRNKTE